MRRYITLPNILYFALISAVFNSYLLIRACPYLLILILPLFLALNILPGMRPAGTRQLRLKLCNHGTVLLVLYAIPEKIKLGVADAYNVTLRALGDETPDFLAAVQDLTAEECRKRNELLTVPDGIYAQSVGSVMDHPRKGQFPLNLSYRYVKNFDGENDGLVGEASFAWGEKYTLLRIEGDRGISHGDVIDLNRENIRGFDVRAFYTDLVSDLRERGL